MRNYDNVKLVSKQSLQRRATTISQRLCFSARGSLRIFRIERDSLSLSESGCARFTYEFEATASGLKAVTICRRYAVERSMPNRHTARVRIHSDLNWWGATLCGLMMKIVILPMFVMLFEKRFGTGIHHVKWRVTFREKAFSVNSTVAGESHF